MYKQFTMTNQAKNILQWLFILILTFQFLLLGYSKLLGEMSSFFIDNGYSLDFMYIVGFLEILASIGLFFRPYRNVSSFIVMIIMVGAFYTHLMNDEIIQVLVNITNVGLAAIVLWVESEKKYAREEMIQNPQSY